MCKFQTQHGDRWLQYSRKHYPGKNARWPRWWLVHSGADNGLVPPGNKPLHKTELTEISDAISRRWVTMTWLIDRNSDRDINSDLILESLYRQTSNISHTLVVNKIDDHSVVVRSSPVGANPTSFSFSTQHLASMDWAETITRRYEIHLSVGILCDLY